MSAHVDRIKLVVVGDSGVGKSTFVNSLVNQTPCYNCSSTIGCSAEVLHYVYSGRQSRNVFLEFWDVGGSSGHKLSRSIYYANFNGIILVHDLTNRKSFSNLKAWLDEVLNSGRQELTGVSVRGSGEQLNNSSPMTTVPLLLLATKEGQHSSDETTSMHHLGLTDHSDVFFLDMNCYQQSQLLPTSNKWVTLSEFFDKVIETRYYPSLKQQESEYWRGRKKIFT